ncbi:MAG: hypothetical protein AB1439_00780 [candidate division FCPU426 bacterium]
MEPNDDSRAWRRRQIIEGVQKILSGLFRLGLMALLLYLIFKYFAK